MPDEYFRLTLDGRVVSITPELTAEAKRLEAEQAEVLEKAADKKETEKLEAVSRTIRFQQERAKAGSAQAQYDLGMRYLKGDGLDKEEQVGLTWLRKAATNGHKQAALFLQKFAATNSASVNVK